MASYSLTKGFRRCRLQTTLHVSPWYEGQPRSLANRSVSRELTATQKFPMSARTIFSCSCYTYLVRSWNLKNVQVKLDFVKPCMALWRSRSRLTPRATNFILLFWESLRAMAMCKRVQERIAWSHPEDVDEAALASFWHWTHVPTLRFLQIDVFFKEKRQKLLFLLNIFRFWKRTRNWNL